MSHKPSDFLIGIVDFFAILLPGAVAAFFGIDLARQYVLKRPEIFGELTTIMKGEAERWIVFVIASYLLGQFVYLLGSLADEVYDPFRKFFSLGWVKSARHRKSYLFRFLTREWDKNERLYREGKRIKDKKVGDAGREIVNTFKWAKAMIQIKCPEAAAEISRFEADQKFFRGLMVVLLIVCALLLFYYKVGLTELIPYLVLMALSFLRYVDQRRKSQNLAYTYLIALDKMEPET